MADQTARPDDSRPVPTLTGTKVVLRAPRRSDVDDLREIGRRPEIVRAFGSTPSPDRSEFSDEELEDWFAGLLEEPHAWIVEHKGRGVGELRLEELSSLHGFAEVVLVIADPELHGRGLGSEALELVADHAFGELGLHRLGMRVMDDNEPAIGAAESCGFVVEGREREVALVDGERHDIVLLGLLAREWRARRAA